MTQEVGVGECQLQFGRTGVCICGHKGCHDGQRSGMTFDEFADGCPHFSGQWETPDGGGATSSHREEGDGRKNAVLVYCGHLYNGAKDEGNCCPSFCPRLKLRDAREGHKDFDQELEDAAKLYKERTGRDFLAVENEFGKRVFDSLFPGPRNVPSLPDIISEGLDEMERLEKEQEKEREEQERRRKKMEKSRRDHNNQLNGVLRGISYMDDVKRVASMMLYHHWYFKARMNIYGIPIPLSRRNARFIRRVYSYLKKNFIFDESCLKECFDFTFNEEPFARRNGEEE